MTRATGRNVHAPKPRPTARACRPDRAAHVETVRRKTQGGDIHGTQRNAGAPAPGAGRADRGGGRGDARRAVRADRAMADAARQAGGAVPARRQHRRDRQAAGGRTGQDLGQTVIVENKGGANGNIGSDAVAKAEPDGYTLLLSGVGSNAINYALYASMPYRDSDFAHVSLLATGPNVLVAAPDFPARPSRTSSGWRARARTSTPTPARAAARPATWPWKCSSSRPGSIWCTCRTRAARRPSRTCWAVA